ncbi:MAG: VIT domain-containing protein [Bacteroidota bacterium]
MQRLCFSFIFIVLLCFAASQAEAGRLYARKPGTASPIYNLLQTETHTRTTLRNLLAITHVDETFHNDQTMELEGYYVFSLPEGSTVDGLWMWLDGKRYTFQVKRKEEAQQIYDSLNQHNIGDPVILESMGANRFQIRITPIHPNDDRRIELQYFQVLPVTPEGIVRYDYPMNMTGYQGMGVQVLDVQVALSMDAPIEMLETNFDDRPMMLGRTPLSEREMTLHLNAENVVLEEDFTVMYRLTGWADSLFVLRHSDLLAADSSTFLVWFPDTIDASAYAKVDFVFTIDASASMTGLRRGMVLYAIERVLVRLMRYDRFAIVLFNDRMMRFPADTAMAFAEPEAIISALQFLRENFQPRGTTNYQSALSALATTAFRPEAHHRCVFVTDGLPNAGVRTVNGLLPSLMIENKLTSLYPMTIYTDNIGVLSELARLSGGKLTALEQGMNIDDALERLTFDFASSTVLQAMLEYPSGVLDAFPQRPLYEIMPARMTGAGRYAESVDGPCAFSYTLPGIGIRTSDTRTLTLDNNPNEVVQVARYWAALRIQQLLDQLRDVTDSTEIKEAVIRLSEKYMILTPFTAFIIYREPDDPGGELAAGELAVPETMQLQQNYPNPFNPSTSIRFFLPHHVSSGAGGAAMGSVRVYDVLGRLVRVLADNLDSPGWQVLTWDGRDTAGRFASSGTYLCVLSLGGEQRMITMTLLK